MRIRLTSTHLENKRIYKKQYLGRPKLYISLGRFLYSMRKCLLLYLLVLMFFSACSIDRDIGFGDRYIHPDKSKLVYSYVQNTDPSQSNYYLMQLILTDMEGTILDSINSRTSAVLPYHVEWLENGNILAIKGKYQVTRIFDLVEDELKRNRNWNKEVKVIDDMMWERLKNY